MKITHYLNRPQILIDLKSTDKLGVLKELTQVLIDQGLVPAEHREDIIAGLVEREELTSTGLGYGLAMPHIKTKAVTKIQIVFGRSVAGIDFASLDGNPAHLFFLILAPPEMTTEYLKVISVISALMKDADERQRLLRARSQEEVFSFLGSTK
ncbi:MAG: PTS sugar transporter subunit IIA [Candidatus Aminicenantales bacterium]|jgi:PTS system nitrogen regulatory IIA component